MCLCGMMVILTGVKVAFIENKKNKRWPDCEWLWESCWGNLQLLLLLLLYMFQLVFSSCPSMRTIMFSIYFSGGVVQDENWIARLHLHKLGDAWKELWWLYYITFTKLLHGLTDWNGIWDSPCTWSYNIYIYIQQTLCMPPSSSSLLL